VADPRGFLKYERVEPEKRTVVERIQDNREFYKPMSEAALREQSLRCMDCGVPFCQSKPNGCPVENLIPDFNGLIADGRWKEALETLHATNNFPEFTGKLCPAPCESACVLGINDSSVSIRMLESSIISRGFEEGWVKPILPRERSGKKVAVVGSGPAGLAAAQQLVRLGYLVTVYEKSDQVGGLLRYGIPDFKMEKWVIERRIEQMIAEGVEFKTCVSVGSDVTLDELRAQNDAICLTLGAEQPRDIRIPGRELNGVHFAMDYLTQQNRRVSGRAEVSGSGSVTRVPISAAGKRVVILGGGDTGSDCLGTAHRQGCVDVMQFELMSEPPQDRHSSTPWPLWPMKLRSSHAHEEGGNRRWGVSTTQFLGRDGKLVGLRAVEVKHVAGRFESIDGTEFEIPADLVILAMGFSGPAKSRLVDQFLALKSDLPAPRLDARGNIVTDAFFRTAVSGVFAAGDVRRGASLIVWAIAEGRKMATSVDEYLSKVGSKA
jgi:glutamate synthase (NADPH/NADH) small chain